MLIAGFAGTVYARARGLARESMREALRFRAETFAGLMEIDHDGIEFEVPREDLPDFGPGSDRAFMVIRDPAGKVVVRSPSVGDAAVPDAGPWNPADLDFAEVDDGPRGIPCSMVTKSFVARAEKEPDEPEAAGWEPPPEEARRYRVQVLLDRRGTEESLAGLARFLAVAGGGALFLALGAGLLLARAVLDPVHRMTAEAASLEPEDPGRRLRPDTVVRELHRLAETLNSAFDRLGEALARQKRFTSDASHELRTPLSVLKANAEHMLRRPRTEEEYREGLRRQLRIAEQMGDITENLLTLARADAATDGMERAPVRLDELALSVSGDFEPVARECGVRLECENGTPVPVLGDALYLRQLVANLVSNAVKFTPAGGRVRVRTVAENGTATLEVEDTGRGIPPEHQKQIFERFYRVEEGRNGAEGAGLGLAIADWIVRVHGGSLSVESRPGQGSRFRVVLGTRTG